MAESIRSRASTRGPRNFTRTGSLAIAHRKALGQSIVITSRHLYTSIADVIMTESLCTIGAYASSFVRGHSPIKKPFIFYFGKKRVRLSTLPKKNKKNTSRALVSRGLRRQNLMFAKNGENMSAIMAKFVFAFPPRRGDRAEICLVVVSAGGLPTRLRKPNLRQ